MLGEGGHPAQQQRMLLRSELNSDPADRATGTPREDARKLFCICGEREAANLCAMIRLAPGGRRKGLGFFQSRGAGDG